MSKQTIGFIGLGLIGGSIAKALRAKHPEITIIAYNRSKDSLIEAMADGTINQAMDTIGPGFSQCDIIFLCAPVSVNIRCLEQLKPIIKPDCILTDVGSVKTPINSLIHSLGLTDCFIGGHPMAGSERIGFANSKAGLLENAYYILAPAPQVPAAKIAEFQGLVTSMGAIPLQVESQKHDYVTAAVSHLPHIVAAALVHLVQDHDDAQGLMKSIAAGGFKDITRIASSSPVMWEQICMTNTVNISRLLQDYIDALGVVQKELQEHDSASLYTFFDGARAYRDSFIDAGSGPIKKDYSIRLDIPDEAGSIAAVSTLLALNNISIKNIGIVHNREAQEGVLRIEFYEEDSITKAIQLLNRRGYVTHI